MIFRFEGYLQSVRKEKDVSHWVCVFFLFYIGENVNY